MVIVLIPRPQPSQDKTKVSAADNDGTSAEKRQVATAHKEEKTALVVVDVAGGLAALWLSSRYPVRSGHEKQGPHSNGQGPQFLSVSQVAVFPNVLKSQETIEPMIPGRAAAVLPAQLARARPRACRCFYPLFQTALVRWFGSWRRRTFLLPLVSASTRVEIAMPIAVSIDAVVIPCSRNRVRMRSASVVPSWRSRLNVSRILLIWDRRVALFVKRASSLACLSSSMSESTLSSFLIRSRISLCISVSSVSVSL